MTQRCTNLQVEHLDAPIGVHTDRPRFSWQVTHAQQAYRLEVRGADGRSFWDTDRVDAAETSLIEYEGEPLGSDAAFTWTVTSWDAAGAAASASSTFETALLSADDWSAHWVEPVQKPTAIERWTLFDWIRGARPEEPVEQRLRPVQLLRQSFSIRRAPVRARLYATARGVSVPYVNGARADEQVLAPGYDSYAHRISVQCYDVTDAVREGDNVLAFALADGWWAGRLGISGSSAQFGDRTSALWQLHLEDADGTTQVIASGPDAVSAAGAWDYADLFIGERFDARRHDAAWASPGFDDASWQPVIDAGADSSTLTPFRGEPIARVAELPALSVARSGGAWVVDFGQVVAGRVRLRMRDLAPGQTITIEHTESLSADGEWFDNIVGINKEQTDVYIAAGGDAEFEPEFTFHGFRFVRVTGIDDLRAEDIVAVVVSSALHETGGFVSSDARLNRLHENVVWSQRANFLSVPTDCPQREKAGWTGDIQVFAPAATNNAQVVPFLSRWLDNLRADQLADGGIPIISPRSPYDIEAAAEGHGLSAIVTAAGWSDAIALVPWTLWERTGDKRVLEENYAAICRWVEYQARIAADELPERLDPAALDEAARTRQALLYNTGEHFGDWLTPSTLVGKPLHLALAEAPKLTSEYIAPMFQARTLTVAAGVAEALGRDTDAADFARRAAEVRAAFAAEYVDENGDLPVRLQGVYVLALAFDMVPEAVRKRTAARLAELVIENGCRLDTGFLSVPFLLDVLWDSGYPDLARRLLWQTEMPSWLYEVDHGATTIWESWDAVAPDGTVRDVSLNHYAFGCVDDWLYRRVAGLQPVAPGWRRARIEPDFEAGVEHVAAHVGTPAGRLAIEWRREGEHAVVRVEVPHGVVADLVTGELVTPLSPGASEHRVPLSSASLSSVSLSSVK